MTTLKERAQAATTSGGGPPIWGHVLGVGLFLTVVAFIPTWGEAFTIPKVTIATITAFFMAPLLWQRRAKIMAARWPMILGAAFVALSCVSLVASGAPFLGSLWGEWARRSGTLFVLVLVLLFAVSTVLSRSEVRTALTWLVGAGIPATAYGLVQMVGADPFPWSDRGWVVSTFGNPNFAAAGLSMLALLTAGLALFGGYRLVWRVLMGPLAALEALVALGTGSSVAIFAVAAGALLGSLAWVLRMSGPRRSWVAGGLALVALVGAALTALGLLGSGPLAAAVSPDTLQFRRWYWGAGLRMALANPIVGVGPDGYGRFYGEFRSAEAAKMFTLGVNNAHDVPLQWAATLGVPAALIYIALVILVAITALRRLWQQGPSASTLAIGVLAAWGAYQVQSLVSIDETAVAVMGWSLMGLLLAVTRPEERTRTDMSGITWLAAAALGIIGLLAWLPALLSSNASKVVVQGTTEADVLAAASLVGGSTLPCQGAVPVAAWMVSAAPSQVTVDPVLAYAERDDRCYGMVSAAADIALQLDLVDRSLALSQQAVAIDPLNYGPWLLLARAEHLSGDASAAQVAIDQANALAPGNGDVAKTAEDLGLALPAPPA